MTKESARQDLPPVAERFTRYVRFDTRSDPDSETVPSTAKQLDLSRLLVEELRELGVDDAERDENGYVYATVSSALAENAPDEAPVLALVAHVDTSPDEPGGPVEPIVHRDYDGSVIRLPGDPEVTLDPDRSPALLDHVGHDLITSDGTTLLGSDDKAGVALIVQLAADLLADSDWPRPTLRLCFTVDEEIGRGVDHLDLERLGADLAYTVDGGSVGTLETETFNASEATLSIHGVNVHPGYAKDVMANAVEILARLLATLPGNETPETTEGREGYLFAHQIEGSASRAQAKILLRDFTDEGMERRRRILETAAEAARLANPRARIELSVEETYRNMRRYIEEVEPRAISLARSAAEAIGLDLEVGRIRGGTDGSRLSEMGLPCPNVFTGGHDFHSRFEWNTVQNLETALEYLKHLVRQWALAGADSGPSS